MTDLVDKPRTESVSASSAKAVPPTADNKAHRRLSVILPAALTLIVTAAIIVTWFAPGGTIAIGDLPPFVGSAINGQASWSWNHLVTGVGSVSYAMHLVPQMELLRLSHTLGLGDAPAQMAYYGFIFAFVGLSGAFFARSFSRRTLPAVTGAAVALCNPYVMTQAPAPLAIVTIGVMGFVGGLILRAAGGSKPSTVAFAAACLPMFFVAANPPLLVMVGVWVAIVTLGASAVMGKGATRLAVGFVLRSIPVAVLINAWWIGPFLLSVASLGQGSTFTAQTDVASWSWTVRRNTLQNVLGLNSSWGWAYSAYFPYAKSLNGAGWAWMRFVAPLLALSAPLLARSYQRRRQSLAMVSLLLILLFIGKGLHAPLANVNLFLYNHVPGMWLLREPVGKLAPIMVLMYVALIAIAVTSFQDRATQLVRSGSTRWIRVLLVFPILSSVVYVWPLWTGATVAARPPFPSAHVQVPTDWFQAADVVNNDPNGKAFVLPLDDYYQVPVTWGFYGVDYVSQLLFKNGAVQQLPSGYYGNLAPVANQAQGALTSIQANNGIDAVAKLKTLGVSQIVLRHDILRTDSNRHFADDKQLSAVLNDTPGVTRVYNSTLLEVFRFSGLNSVVSSATPGGATVTSVTSPNPATYKVTTTGASANPVTIRLAESYSGSWKLTGLPAGVKATHVESDGWANEWQLSATPASFRIVQQTAVAIHSLIWVSLIGGAICLATTIFLRRRSKNIIFVDPVNQFDQEETEAGIAKVIDLRESVPAETNPAAAAVPVAATRRLDSLTSLRWFAALLVFGRHASGYLPPDVQRYLLPGADGVSFFFMLSGFVLAWSHRQGDKAVAFYRRRFARVYPANAVMCLVALYVGVYMDHRHGYTFAMVIASLALVQNWSTHWAGGPNSVAWSLSCEVFFYAMFPVIIMVAPRLTLKVRRLATAGAALAVVVLALLLTTPEPSTPFYFLYYFPPTRLLEFVIGVALALEIRNGTLPRIPMSVAATVAVVACIVCSAVQLSLSWAALTLVPWALLITSAAQNDLAGTPSWLRQRALVFLGEVSFCFYLVHQVLLRVFYDWWQFPKDVNEGYFMFVFAAVIALGCATALHLGVERPMEKWLRGSRPRLNDEAVTHKSFTHDQPVEAS